MKTCRCAEVSAPAGEVAPSDSVAVDCRWDTSGLRGAAQSNFVVVYVEGQSEEYKNLHLAVRGEVLAEFDLSPPRIEFVQGEAATRSFRLIPKDPASGPIIEKASCSHKVFRVASQSDREVQVAFSPELWPNDLHLPAELVVLTNCKTERACKIPLRVMAKKGA